MASQGAHVHTAVCHIESDPPRQTAQGGRVLGSCCGECVLGAGGGGCVCKGSPGAGNISS